MTDRGRQLGDDVDAMRKAMRAAMVIAGIFAYATMLLFALGALGASP